MVNLLKKARKIRRKAANIRSIERDLHHQVVRNLIDRERGLEGPDQDDISLRLVN